MTINDAEMRPNEFNSIVVALNNYISKAQKYIEAKNSLLNNVKNKVREKSIKGFKKRIFLLKSDVEFEQQTSKKPIKTDANAFNEWINKKETGNSLFKKHFNFQRPSSMFKDLYQINDREKNNNLVTVVNSGLRDLKKKLEKVKSDKIVEIVEEILKFNKQIQQGNGLKILTSNQMLSRLLSLAQIKAGKIQKILKMK